MRKMKSEHKKTNASRQARSQLHLSEGVATKREQCVTDLTQLQIVPECSFSATRHCLVTNDIGQEEVVAYSKMEGLRKSTRIISTLLVNEP